MIINVSQGESSAKQKNPVRALLVQHQTACLCLSAGTTSQWTTIFFTVKVSSGLASTFGFTSRGGLRVHVYFGDLPSLGGSKDQGLCLPPRGNAPAAEVRKQQLWETIQPGLCTASKALQSLLNAKWRNWNRKYFKFCYTKYFSTKKKKEKNGMSGTNLRLLSTKAGGRG